MGHLYPVLRAADGELLDGNHRLSDDPDWPERILETVRTPEQKLLVTAHANMGRRDVGKQERIRIVRELAGLYEARGLKVRKAFTYMRKDPNQGEVMQTTYVNEIVDKLELVLEGCLARGTIQHYLSGTAFVQRKGPQPATKQRSTKDRELYRTKGALACLRRFYSKDMRERFDADFVGKLKEELLKEANGDLERKIRKKYEAREKQLRSELYESREVRRAWARDHLRKNKAFRDEVREEILLELEAFELNLQNVIYRNSSELRKLEKQGVSSMDAQARLDLEKNGALTPRGELTPQALQILEASR